ncbi:uncharacterized protein TNCV_863381 [Trichonephila clavipes]|nr:uncharacterized protein TNCV_863381 [Trichonephila clavipes]
MESLGHASFPTTTLGRQDNEEATSGGSRLQMFLGTIRENRKRRVRGRKDKINVKMPKLINSYNKHIGGVDHHYWLTGLYSIVIRGKKWKWPFFIRSLDMAVVNAGIIHKTLNKDEVLNLKESRRAMTTIYIKKTVIRKRGRPRASTAPSGAKEDTR